MPFFGGGVGGAGVTGGRLRGRPVTQAPLLCAPGGVPCGTPLWGVGCPVSSQGNEALLYRLIIHCGPNWVWDGHGQIVTDLIGWWKVLAVDLLILLI